jgi:hypothetical protein
MWYLWVLAHGVSAVHRKILEIVVVNLEEVYELDCDVADQLVVVEVSDLDLQGLEEVLVEPADGLDVVEEVLDFIVIEYHHLTYRIQHLVDNDLQVLDVAHLRVVQLEDDMLTVLGPFSSLAVHPPLGKHPEEALQLDHSLQGVLLVQDAVLIAGVLFTLQLQLSTYQVDHIVQLTRYVNGVPSSS